MRVGISNSYQALNHLPKELPIEALYLASLPKVRFSGFQNGFCDDQIINIDN